MIKSKTSPKIDPTVARIKSTKILHLIPGHVNTDHILPLAKLTGEKNIDGAALFIGVLHWTRMDLPSV
jgi:hypothetical protein